MGVIPNEIPEQAFELIRDRIANIISDELSQQAAINYTDDLDATVWLERFIPFSASELSHGAVNVQYDGTNYTSESQPTADGTCNFSIDCYFNAKSSVIGQGDKMAKIKLQRLIGVIRGILMDTRYNTLGFARPFIMNRRVADIKIADPINTQDATSSVMGRIVFAVRVNENVALSSVRVLDEYVTQAIIGVSDQGYLYSGTSAPPVDPICEGVSVLINGVSSYDVTSGGTLSLTIVDTDGVEQGVISGTTITVPAVGGTLDIDVNGTPFYVDISTDQDLPVKNNLLVNVGSKIGPNYIIGDTNFQVNNATITTGAAEGTSGIDVINTASDPVGTDIGGAQLQIGDSSATIKNTANETLLSANLPAEGTGDFIVGDCTGTFNGDPITDLPAEQNKAIIVRNTDLNNVGLAVVDTTNQLTVTVFDSEVEVLNSDATYDVPVSVVAGGVAVHNLPDVTMTQPNGDTLSYPSVKNFACTLISALANSDLISDITDAQLVALYNSRITINVIELTTLGAQNYSKPANLLYADVICVGAGGGGSSGQRRAAPTASQGGGGGGAGAIARRRILASAMAGTEVVTVGAGGGGGAAQTADNGLQLGGTAGGSTSFGTLVVAVGGFGGTNGSNAAGTITVRTANTPNTSQLNIQGNIAGAGGTTGAGTTGHVMTTSSIGLHYGGGGGGALSAATPGVENVGGAGSRIYDASGVLSAANAGGLASGGNGNNGNNNVALQVQLYESILHTIGLGSSGSGGGSENAGVAGTGGNGGLYGAGGGGGAGSRNGNNSGAGGAGAQGCVIIYEFLV